jgi:hypothetical protein
MSSTAEQLVHALCQAGVERVYGAVVTRTSIVR